MRKKGMSRSFSGNFYLTVAKYLRWGTLLCLMKFLIGKSVKVTEGGCYHDCPSKFFVSQYRYIPERNLSLLRRSFDIEKCYECERRLVSRFSIEIVQLTLPKHFVEEPFCVWRNFLESKKIRDKRVGPEIDGASQFAAANFLFHSAENFCMGTL